MLNTLQTRNRRSLISVVIATNLFLGLIQSVFADEPTSVRSQAVVSLGFDEAVGDALDSASVGTAKDNGKLQNGATRVASPFFGQTGKRAILLDSANRQFVQLADSPDLDRGDAVTVNLLYADLHPLGDTAYHGVFAKRDDARQITNYGINYSRNGDTFQVYLNDGTGFKSAVFSLNDTIGRRRPVFVSALLQVGDAPAPDADADADDVLIRLFINGKQVKPKAASSGLVAENDVWLTDVKVANLVNDVPLVIGASSPTIEHSSCFIDEFTLFAKALSAEEIARLYAEIVGPQSSNSVVDEGKPIPAGPEITSLSLYGLTRGRSTVVAVTGTNLSPEPVLVGSTPIEKQSIRPGATPERVEFEIATPATAMTGHYSLRVQTAHGVSGALPIAVDALPQIHLAEITAEKPVTLPTAVSGTLSGEQQIRIPFLGKAGQRLVIDLECKRLGGGADPVMELKNPRGAPLNIAWGRPQLRGDARIEVNLFADGVYTVELHDLAFKGPGSSPFRMKIGDLKLIDTTFPAAVAAGSERTVSAIGPGIDPAAKLAVDMQHEIPGTIRAIGLTPETGDVGPAPAVVASGAIEIEENLQEEGKVQSIDARFAEKSHVPLAVNGRLGRARNSDKYLLNVVPGVSLTFSVESHSLRSPLEPRIEIRSQPDGALLAASEERPVLEYTPPPGVSSLQLNVDDLNHRGGADFVYRLRCSKTGSADFSLALAENRLTFAGDGNSVVRIDANRTGYDGPITLSLVGDAELQLSPAEIPAGATKAWVVVSSRNKGRAAQTPLHTVKIVGTSVGLEPPIVRAAQTPFDSRMTLVPSARYELNCILTARSTGSLELGNLPVSLFRGVDLGLPVVVQGPANATPSASVRFTVLTTETARTIVDPTDPTQQRRIQVAMIRGLPEQVLPVGEKTGELKVLVPLEVVEGHVDCVIRADFVSQPFSDVSLATVYSKPFRLPVQNAVAAQLAANSIALASNAPSEFTGTIQRTAGFTGEVEVSLANLPMGYTAPKVVVPAGQEKFKIVVTAPAISAAADIPNVQFRVTTSTGSLLQKDTPVSVKASP